MSEPSVSSVPSLWYYRKGRRKRGPFSVSALMGAYLCDDIDEETLLWNGTSVAEWTPLWKVTAIYTLVHSEAPHTDGASVATSDMSTSWSSCSLSLSSDSSAGHIRHATTVHHSAHSAPVKMPNSDESPKQQLKDRMEDDMYVVESDSKMETMRTVGEDIAAVKKEAIDNESYDYPYDFGNPEMGFPSTEPKLATSKSAGMISSKHLSHGAKSHCSPPPLDASAIASKTVPYSSSVMQSTKKAGFYPTAAGSQLMADSVHGAVDATRHRLYASAPVDCCVEEKLDFPMRAQPIRTRPMARRTVPSRGIAMMPPPIGTRPKSRTMPLPDSSQGYFPMTPQPLGSGHVARTTPSAYSGMRPMASLRGASRMQQPRHRHTVTSSVDSLDDKAFAKRGRAQVGFGHSGAFGRGRGRIRKKVPLKCEIPSATEKLSTGMSLQLWTPLGSVRPLTPMDRVMRPLTAKSADVYSTTHIRRSIHPKRRHVPIFDRSVSEKKEDSGKAKKGKREFRSEDMTEIQGKLKPTRRRMSEDSVKIDSRPLPRDSRARKKKRKSDKRKMAKKKIVKKKKLMKKKASCALRGFNHRTIVEESHTSEAEDFGMPLMAVPSESVSPAKAKHRGEVQSSERWPLGAESPSLCSMESLPFSATRGAIVGVALERVQKENAPLAAEFEEEFVFYAKQLKDSKQKMSRLVESAFQKLGKKLKASLEQSKLQCEMTMLKLKMVETSGELAQYESDTDLMTDWSDSESQPLAKRHSLKVKHFSEEPSMVSLCLDDSSVDVATAIAWAQAKAAKRKAASGHLDEERQTQQLLQMIGLIHLDKMPCAKSRAIAARIKAASQ